MPEYEIIEEIVKLVYDYNKRSCTGNSAQMEISKFDVYVYVFKHMNTMHSKTTKYLIHSLTEKPMIKVFEKVTSGCCKKEEETVKYIDAEKVMKILKEELNK